MIGSSWAPTPTNAAHKRLNSEFLSEFDRNGTKAAAITFFEGVKNAAPPAEVIFDHPFIFTITDTSNGMPLFVGITAQL